MNEVNPAQLAHYVAWGAFALAFVFGAVGNKTDFCTMGAVSDWVNMGDFNRMRMWLLAIAVAVLGANGLQLAGVVNLSKSIYQTPSFTWLSYIVGGFLFGVGMTLGSGCGSKTLIRIGAGNLKSVVVFVFLGIAAYMTLRGLFGAFRVDVLEKASLTLPGGQDLPNLMARATGIAQEDAGSRFSPSRSAAGCSRSSTRAGISVRTSITRSAASSPAWWWSAAGTSAGTSATWPKTRTRCRRPSSPPTPGAWSRSRSSRRWPSRSNT